jgi:hypothetical protein
MLISLDAHQMRSLDGNSLIKLACDELSEYGIENFIHWHDEISVSIDDVPYNVMIDYVAGGVRFLKP